MNPRSFENDFPLNEFSPLFAPFSQRIIQDRNKLLYEAICHEQDSLVKPYQDGVMLMFTEQTLALLFDPLKHDSTLHSLNKLYASDLGSIHQACAVLTTHGEKPIRAFCFNQVFGHIQLPDGSSSYTNTLEQLRLLLTSYGPGLMELNLSNNQLTDAEAASRSGMFKPGKQPVKTQVPAQAERLSQ